MKIRMCSILSDITFDYTIHYVLHHVLRDPHLKEVQIYDRSKKVDMIIKITSFFIIRNKHVLKP